MVTRRIVPCLDVAGGRTVKGVRFVDLADVGDPVALAERYGREGADELVVLDIMATLEGRGTFTRMVEAIADVLTIPLAVGGGVRSEHDVERLLRAGADKVAINSAALADPALITRCADAFGVQCVVVAVDSIDRDGIDMVVSRAGTAATERTLVDWCVEAEGRGAGEFLLTSIDRDGTGLGFACGALRAVAAATAVPIVASGGARGAADFAEVFRAGADAALAAGIFHRGEVSIADVKRHLFQEGLPVRWRPV